MSIKKNKNMISKHNIRTRIKIYKLRGWITRQDNTLYNKPNNFNIYQLRKYLYSKN